MKILNKQVFEMIYTLPDEDAFLFLQSISSRLYSSESDIGNFKLTKSNTLDKVRNKIKEYGTDDIEKLSIEITKIIMASTNKSKKQDGIEVEQVAAKPKDEINDQILKKVNSIEHSKWLNGIEVEAIMRAEDPAYPTPNLNDMREKAKWQFFHLACAKIKILKALKVEV
jgi:hypothetical protein